MAPNVIQCVNYLFTLFCVYPFLRIEDESTNYRLWVADYYGNATNSFSAHNGYYFSTVDKNNDEAPSCCPCAPSYGGGWWFYRYPIVNMYYILLLIILLIRIACTQFKLCKLLSYINYIPAALNQI